MISKQSSVYPEETIRVAVSTHHVLNECSPKQSNWENNIQGNLFLIVKQLKRKAKTKWKSIFSRTNTVRVKRIFSYQRDNQNNNELANIIKFIYWNSQIIQNKSSIILYKFVW